MDKSRDLLADLAAFRQTYIDMFGQMPPTAGGKYELSAEIDPEALRLMESMRAHAFAPGVFDKKTIQLLLFAMALACGSSSVRWHAVAARRAGASWSELHKVVELAAAAQALAPLDTGTSVLCELRNQEK